MIEYFVQIKFAVDWEPLEEKLASENKDALVAMQKIKSINIVELADKGWGG